jgi:hypothetical protein
MTKRFEEITYNDCIDKLVRNILNVEQIIDDNDKSITITPSEGL